jgi:GAF domain-containing protein
VDHLAPLQAITSALSRSLSPEEVAGVVIGHAHRVVNASAAAAFFRSPPGEGPIKHIASRGIAASVANGWNDGTVPLPPLVQKAAAGREALWYETHEELVTEFPSVRYAATPAERLQAMVMLPLKIGDKFLGVIGFSFGSSRKWSAEQRHFLLTVAEVCAQALERTYLYDAERIARAEANEGNRRLKLLSEAAKAFAESNRDLSSALSVIAQQLTEMVGGAATIALISLIREDGTLMENVAARAQDPEFSQQLVAFARENPQRVGVGLRGRVAATGGGSGSAGVFRRSRVPASVRSLQADHHDGRPAARARPHPGHDPADSRRSGPPLHHRRSGSGAGPGRPGRPDHRERPPVRGGAAGDPRA